MAASSVTSKNGMVRTVLSFLSPCDLGKATCVNSVWHEAGDMEWAQTMPRSKAEVARFFNARREVRLLLQSHRRLIERMGFYGLGGRKPNVHCGIVSIIFSFLFWLGLLATGILFTVKADGQKSWPHWLVPLVAVACGTPSMLCLCGHVCMLLSTCPFICKRRKVASTVRLIGPLMDDRREFDSMAVAVQSESFRRELEHAHDEMATHFARESITINGRAYSRQPLDNALRSVVDAVIGNFGCVSLDVFLVLPIWLTMVFSLLHWPSLACLAPLYFTFFSASIALLFWTCAYDVDAKTGETWLAIYMSVVGITLAAAIFSLGLQIDGLIHCPIAVLSTFMLSLALIGGATSVMMVQMIWKAPSDRCRLMAGFLSEILAVAAVAIGILSLYQKATGGILSVIPYGVVIWVMLTSAPMLFTILAVFSFYF